MKFDQSPQKPSVDQAEYTKALIDKLGEQNLYWRMTLDLLARKDLEKPLVIPNTIIANGDITVPDGIVAIRATSNQTAAVTLTANGNIPIPVSSAYGAQQVVTGRLVSLGVSGLASGNTVWVQMLNERAARYTASGAGVVGLGTDGNPAEVELTGSLVGLPQPTAVTVFSIPYSALTASTTYNAMAQKSLTRAVRQRTFYWTNFTNQLMSSASIKIVDSEFAGGSSNPAYWPEVPFTAIPGADTYGNYPAIADSLSLPALGVMGDSVIVSFAVGATLPTGGSIDIAVLEG